MDFEERRKLVLYEEKLQANLLQSAWFQKMTERAQNVARNYPPHYLYRIKANGLVGTIKRYVDPPNPDQAFRVSVYCLTEDNKHASLQKDVVFNGVPPEDLERVVLASVAQIERIRQGHPG